MDRTTVAGDTYLKLRDRMYYLEMRVPKHLVPVLRKTHMRQSLKTADKREAKRLLNLKVAEIEQQFVDAEKQLSAQQCPLMLDEISEGRIKLIASQWLKQEQSQALHRFREHHEDNTPLADDVVSSAKMISGLNHMLMEMEQSSEVTGGYLQDLLVRVAQSENIACRTSHHKGIQISGPMLDAEPNGLNMRRFREAVRQAWCEALRFELALWRGERYEPRYADVVGTSNSREVGETKLTLSHLIEIHETEPRYLSASKKLQYKYEYLFRLLKEVIGGEKVVGEIGRKDCRQVREVLLQLPANATKKFPRLSFREIAEKVSALPAHKRPPMLDEKTRNGHLHRMSTFFQFAVNETHMVVNPAKGLASDDAKHSKSDRSPFTTAELVAIFGSQTFCSPPGTTEGRLCPLEPSKESTRYWVVVIALFHGMRANEICQLRISDVKNEGGVRYFNVNESQEGQRLKTEAAEREIPFHPILERLGFPIYLASLPSDAAGLLFPDLSADSTGYYSRNVTRWFNDRLLVELGLKRKRLSFHSLRHNFQDATRRAGLRPQVEKALCGRDEGGSGAKYGDGFRARDLATEIARIDYPGLEIATVPRKAN